MHKLNIYTKIITAFTFVWIVVSGLQALEIIKFGKSELELWKLFVVSALYIMMLVYYIKTPNTKNHNVSINLTSFYLIFFFLASMFDLYTITFWVNRLEHVIGTLICCFIAEEFIDRSKVADKKIYALSVIGFVAILTSFNEMMEMIFHYFKGNVITSIYDTSLDVTVNLLTSIAFVIFRVLRFK